MSSNVIQVINIASGATEENIKLFFGFFGPIRNSTIYFKDAQNEETKVAYITFENASDAEASLELQNSLLCDKALIISILPESFNGEIPDENYAKIIRPPEKTVSCVASKIKTWPDEVITVVYGKTGEQAIYTIEPNFAKQGLPAYPKLPFTTEASKVDEIRRTILVTNLNSSTTYQHV